jgi:hypothetical protein
MTATWATEYGQMATAFLPTIYDPWSTSTQTISEDWLFNPNGGAVVYIGENVDMPDSEGATFITTLYNSKSIGFDRIGDMFRLSQQQYYETGSNTNPPGPYDAPRIYNGIMNLLGDPSMRTL